MVMVVGLVPLPVVEEEGYERIMMIIRKIFQQLLDRYSDIT